MRCRAPASQTPDPSAETERLVLCKHENQCAQAVGDFANIRRVGRGEGPVDEDQLCVSGRAGEETSWEGAKQRGDADAVSGTG